MNNEPVDYPPLKAGGIIENNEPVAWIQDLNEVKRKQLVYEQGMDWKDPLYLHPAKTLTDEEITEVLNDENIAEYHQGNWLVLPYAFARAILRKASEK